VHKKLIINIVQSNSHVIFFPETKNFLLHLHDLKMI